MKFPSFRAVPWIRCRTKNSNERLSEIWPWQKNGKKLDNRNWLSASGLLGIGKNSPIDKDQNERSSKRNVGKRRRSLDHQTKILQTAANIVGEEPLRVQVMSVKRRKIQYHSWLIWSHGQSVQEENVETEKRVHLLQVSTCDLLFDSHFTLIF